MSRDLRLISLNNDGLWQNYINTFGRLCSNSLATLSPMVIAVGMKIGGQIVPAVVDISYH
jgi:hypothetical protein